MRSRRSLSLIVAVTAASAAAILHGCGSSSGNGAAFNDMDASGSSSGGLTDTGTSSDGSSSGSFGDVGNGTYTDFPSTPVLDAPDGGGAAAPTNAGTLFGGGATSDGGANAPCLVESEVDSLLPRNWLPPRFRWTAGGGENLFELRLHVDNQTNDLVVYTSQMQWTMPLLMWNALARDSAGVPMTVSVRGGVFDGTALTAISQGSNGAFGIAPADAPGAIVYWHIIGAGDGELKGFNVGDDSVRSALPATSVKEYTTTCIGCHTSTPDGKYAVFSSSATPQNDAFGTGIGSVETTTVGQTPPFLSTAGASALENLAHGIMTTSLGHWAAGDYMMIATSRDDKSLTWVQLDGADNAATGTLAITGDPNTDRVAPSWSHDGAHIVYTSANQSADGRPSGSGNDLYVVPYGNRAGGAATALANANTADNEYYPVYSPDDKWIAFNRTSQPDTYAQSGAEVYVAAADGTGAAQRLVANDPPACSGTVSPGVSNSWPKWAPAKPAPTTVKGLTYYWVVFSSIRSDGSTPQLYMAPVVIDAAGTVQPHRAVYLWNQPSAEHNHTPAWDVFAIPPAPPR